MSYPLPFDLSRDSINEFYFMEAFATTHLLNASCILFSSKISIPYVVRQRSTGISLGSSVGSQCAARSLLSNAGEIRLRLAVQN